MESTLDQISERKLRSYFENESQTLLSILRVYVGKAHLTKDRQEVNTIALELLNETFIKALDAPERFDSDRAPQAWVLGIASNLIKQRQDKSCKLARREADTDDFSAFIESIVQTDSFEKTVMIGELLRSILTELSHADQEILQLAMEYEMSGQAIAMELGISEGTARVRLHRALRRANDIWVRQGQPITKLTQRVVQRS